MDFTINRVKLLYTVGVALGIAAILYFGFQLFEELSPTTTALLLILGFVLFATAGLYVTTNALDTVLYALAAGAYIVFLAYTGSTFNLNSTDIFLLLAGSSILFIGLGYLSTEDYLALTPRQAQLIMLGAIILGVLLVAVDVSSAQPSYSTDFQTSIEVPELRTDATIGTVTATNPFFFSRTIDPPQYHACLYTPDYYPIPLVRYDDYSNAVILSGGESRTFDLTLQSSVFYDRLEPRGDLANTSTIPVEHMTECPDQSDTVKLVIATGDIRPPPPR